MRVYVYEKSKFTSLYLGLNDESGHNASYDALGDLTDATWGDTHFSSLVDISTWGNMIGVTIIAQGTNNSANVGLTKFYIDFLAVEFS